MHIFTGKWQDGYLDYYRHKNFVRIQVQAWQVCLKIRDMFVEQPRDIRRVWNYLFKYGPRMVIRKIIVRYGERFRDNKVLALGVGMVIESDSGLTGKKVLFIAPSHPPCVERVVLPQELILPIDDNLFNKAVRKDGIIYAENEISDKRYDQLAGWCEYSGWKLPSVAKELLEDAKQIWQGFDLSRAKILPLSPSSPVMERTQRNIPGSSKPSGIIFGFGNHSKTIIVPNVSWGINIAAVHEIDPTELGRVSSYKWEVDSSPDPRTDRKYDVYFISGYHNSHASQAAHALNSGAWAVVEKPLVTTWQELGILMGALNRDPHKFFAGFHMRYNKLWNYAKEDINPELGQPINYHAMVYEVPIPRRHWYNWPNAHSRIVSNGCHWVDHFLYLNNFNLPQRYDVWKAKNGDIHFSMELQNGAVFGLHLTDQGSKRVGVQDHIELRANGITVRVDNGSRYVSENRHKIIRKEKVNLLNSYKNMYRSICRKIIQGEKGDDVKTVKISSETMLKLEDAYMAS